MYSVEITDFAETDIRHAFAWWQDNRSGEQAARWYKSIRRAIANLKDIADRCPPAIESELHSLGLRELHFGIGRRPTHGIVFVLDGRKVTVYRIRHSAQGILTSDDLP